MDDWVTIAVSVLALIVSVAGLAITYRSLQVANRSAVAAEVSARAADKSATAADKTAEVSARAAAVAEAGLRISFRIDAKRHSSGDIWFSIYSQGANIYIHKVYATFIVVTRDGRKQPFHHIELKGVNGVEVPFIHDDEGISYIWENSGLRQDDRGLYGTIIVVYSVTLNGDKRERSKFFEFPDGFAAQDQRSFSPAIVQQRTDADE